MCQNSKSDCPDNEAAIGTPLAYPSVKVEPIPFFPNVQNAIGDLYWNISRVEQDFKEKYDQLIDELHQKDQKIDDLYNIIKILNKHNNKLRKFLSENFPFLVTQFDEDMNYDFIVPCNLGGSW